MVELILGMGANRSAYDIIRIADKELAKTQGVPRRVVARTDYAEIIAERTGFEGDYTSYVMRFRAIGDGAKAIGQAVSESGDICSLKEEDGCQAVRLKVDATHDIKQVKEALSKLSKAAVLPEVWRVQGMNYRVDPISVELLFQAMVQYKASDVHLSPGKPPVFRVDNHTRESELLGSISAQQISALIREIAPDQYWEEFQKSCQTSFNYHQAGVGYSRVSAFIKQGAPHCTFRFLPEQIPSFEDLNVPHDTMVQLAELHHGLVLVTGMTGSGKSTTMAALVDWINSHKAVHILTIENPVEYVHTNKKSLISQRSTGIDVGNFFDAVTGALRHDPDVIVIGEMRDPDTIRAAINAAATGHLVISTLHSNTASEVVNRIVSFFDPVERDLVKLQLRDCVKCLICQRLVPRLGGGRIPALEVMFNDIKAINDSIIAGDSDGIRVGMQQTVSHSFIFEKYLLGLYKSGKIDLENARAYCTDVSVIDQMIMGTYSVPRLDSIKAAGGH